jgi:predicted SprT family Zn-dependent metalloprotease
VTFEHMLKRLRASAPPLLPVRVYVRDRLGDALGDTSLERKGKRPSHFVIRIRRASLQVMRDTLLHEWAHAIAWRDGHETVCDHDPEWALAYSRVYQLIVEQ